LFYAFPRYNKKKQCHFQDRVCILVPCGLDQNTMTMNLQIFRSQYPGFKAAAISQKSAKLADMVLYLAKLRWQAVVEVHRSQAGRA